MPSPSALIDLVQGGRRYRSRPLWLTRGSARSRVPPGRARRRAHLTWSRHDDEVRPRDVRTLPGRQGATMADARRALLHDGADRRPRRQEGDRRGLRRGMVDAGIAESGCLPGGRRGPLGGDDRPGSQEGSGGTLGHRVPRRGRVRRTAAGLRPRDVELASGLRARSRRARDDVTAWHDRSGRGGAS